jgi:glyoxylase-like metal-dependent hydrolase (beta-lactamase superfamily II)
LPPDPPLTAGLSVALGGGVYRIVAGNAGMMTGPGTNTYVIGERELAVIDPGPDEERHLQAILAHGAGRIRHVLVTHTHRDHSPLVARLVAATGATVTGMPAPRDGRQDDSFVPQHVPQDGERLRLGECQLTAVHTPGHASNCVCYLLAGEQLLFTGDHVLQGVSPVILPPDGDMSDYFDSLDKLLPLDFERIAPGHGQTMSGGKDVVRALRAHRLAREDKVVRCLAATGGASIAALTPAVYDDVPADRHPVAMLTLEAHLIKLRREGRVRQQGDQWLAPDTA